MSQKLVALGLLMLLISSMQIVFFPFLPYFLIDRFRRPWDITMQVLPGWTVIQLRFQTKNTNALEAFREAGIVCESDKGIISLVYDKVD